MEDFILMDNLKSDQQQNALEEISLSRDHSEYEWNKAINHRQTFCNQKREIKQRRESLKSNNFGNLLIKNEEDIFISLMREKQDQDMLDSFYTNSFTENEQDVIIYDEIPLKSQKILKQEFTSSTKLQKEYEILTDTDASEQNKIKKKNAIKKQNKKIKKFGQLLDILKKWFKGQTISKDDLVLNQQEKIIFLSIIKRKFKTLDYLDRQDLSLDQILKKNRQESTRKRPEENYKFVFKRTLKSLKKQFCKSLKVGQNKGQLDCLFYLHFFGEISQREKIPLQHFHHPNSSQKRTLANFTVPKTINNQYIGNISKSKSFVNQFIQYIDQKILLDYCEVIDNKLENLVNKWEKSLDLKQKDLKDICLYIQYNKKCKLPWNAMEIKSAGEQTKQLFDNNY